MKAREIVEFLRAEIPEEIQEDWDNSGLQIGNLNKEVEKILISLDFDIKTLDYARKNKYDLIITHHPLFFKGIKSIDFDSYIGSLIFKTIEENIPVYSLHTNFDKIKKGVSYQLAKAIGLKDLEFLLEEDEYGYGVVGSIERVELDSFIKDMKKKLNLDFLKLYGENKTIKKVGLCGGSGASFMRDAYEKDVDLYITGDIKYHDSELAMELDLPLLDIGHYNSEKFGLYYLRKILLREFPQLELEILEKPINKYKLY